MPRISASDRLATKTARKRLEPRREPHWKVLQEGQALGYRRMVDGRNGSWIARRQDPRATPVRVFQALGFADDITEPNGKDTLTYAQAQEKARQWFEGLAAAGTKAAEPLTVAKAMEGYLAAYVARGGKALAPTQRAVNAHILPALGAKRVHDLTAAEIAAWHRDLATAPARVRKKVKATKIATRKPSAKAGEADARRATANRVLTILKAALNHAYREGATASDDAWRRVQPFRNADSAKVRYLEDAEATRLLKACPADFRALVTAALLTGCRYGELRALEVGDLNIKAKALTIRTSKSGKARHVVLTDEAGEFFAGLAEGKAGTERLLCRQDGEAWGENWQARPMAMACKAAGISPAISFHILRHTHASRLAHAGVPMAVIATQLGHADLKMTTKHYAHLSPGYVADTIRAAFGSLGINQRDKVVPDTI